MPNVVHVTFDQTGKSKSTNALGMREMQEKAYEGELRIRHCCEKN